MTDLEKTEMLLAKARFPKLRVQVREKRTFRLQEKWQNPRLQILAKKIYDPYYEFRIDPHQKWPYPPETRDSIPVWVWSNGADRWIYYNSIADARAENRQFEVSGCLYYLDLSKTLAADPRNLQEFPR